MREAQRKRAEVANHGTVRAGSDAGESPSEHHRPPTQRFPARAPDLTAAQASVQAAGQKAGAYISSWGAWASEKKKGWAANASNENVAAGGGSPTKPGKWNGGTGGKKVREEKGGDGIGRLDA